MQKIQLVKINSMKQIFTISLLFGVLSLSATPKASPLQKCVIPQQQSLDKVAAMPMAKVNEDIHDLPLIESLPEDAVEQLYSRDSYFFARDGQGQMYNMRDYGRVAYIAVSDTEVYIESPFGGWPTKTWLKGERDGDKVNVTFPQLIYREEYPDWDNDPDGELGLMVTDNYYAYKFILQVGEDKSSFTVDGDNPTITFSFDGTNLMEEGDAFIGMIGEYRMYDENQNPYIGFNWMGFADGMLEYSKVNANPVEVPESVQFEKWILDNQGDLTFVDMAFDGEDVYLRGFIQTETRDGELEFPAMKGTFSDGKLVFSGVQYLGVDPRFEHLAYAMPATYEVGTGEWEGENVYQAEKDLVFEYDEETKVFTSQNGYSLVVSAIPNGIFTVMALDEPVLRWQDMSTPLVPSTPTDLYYEYIEDYGFGVLAFSMTSESEDGRLMDTSNLYYTIYVDGEEFTFYPDEYWDLEEPMTDVPYDYWDSSINSFGDEHEILLYIMMIETIGVKAKYINVDGSVTYSDMATLNTSGLTLTNDNKVISTEWYDLSGCRLSKPGEGIMIKKTVREDGTVEVKKLFNLKH